MNHGLFKEYLSIGIAAMKSTDNFCYEGKPSHVTVKSTLLATSKDEWDTKEEKCIVCAAKNAHW